MAVVAVLVTLSSAVYHTLAASTGVSSALDIYEYIYIEEL